MAGGSKRTPYQHPVGQRGTYNEYEGWKEKPSYRGKPDFRNHSIPGANAQAWGHL
jgi:hypothetical protein